MNMATTSDHPPTSTDEKPPKSVSPVIQPIIDDRQETKIDSVNEILPPSVFVNSEPLREDQVQNAVKFLSHPKVEGSPVMYRKSFLERKGLTKEEIDEAFRRVSKNKSQDPTQYIPATQPIVTNQVKQTISSSNVQKKGPSQIVPAGINSRMDILSRFQWSHALLLVGFLAFSGVGAAVLFKKTIIPRFKSWIRKIVSEEEEEVPLEKNTKKRIVSEEAVSAAKFAANAVADVARTSQEMVMAKSEEKRLFELLTNMLNTQVQEMKSMSNAIKKLEGGHSSMHGRIDVDEQYDRRVRTSSKLPYANGKVDTDSVSVRSLTPPAPVETSVAPHPKSYMEIMEMIQRGEKPSNIREINDAPPNPNQSVSNPRLTPKPKPWEIRPASTRSSYIRTNQEKFLDTNGDNALPWWQSKNVRITETEKESFNALVPPPVMMPEAAAAIRQLNKPYLQTEQLNNDEQLIDQGEDGTVVDANGFHSGLNLSEMRKEENALYLES